MQIKLDPHLDLKRAPHFALCAPRAQARLKKPQLDEARHAPWCASMCFPRYTLSVPCCLASKVFFDKETKHETQIYLNIMFEKSLFLLKKESKELVKKNI